MWGLFLRLLNTCMKFRFYTLIDVTKTDARFNKTDPKWLQQQNFLTLSQTMSLRVNTIVENIECQTASASSFGFGSSYKGEHKVWSGTIDFEYEGGLNIEMLETDFHLVPVINNLEETIKLKDCVFDTKTKQFKNIIFKCVD